MKGTSNPGYLRGGFVVIKREILWGFLPGLRSADKPKGTTGTSEKIPQLPQR